MLAWLKRYRLTILALFLLMLLPFAVVFIKGYFTIRAFDIGRPMQTAVVFDREGRFIGALGETGRYVTIDAIPQDLATQLWQWKTSGFTNTLESTSLGLPGRLWPIPRRRNSAGEAPSLSKWPKPVPTPRRTLKRKFEELAWPCSWKPGFPRSRFWSSI